MVCHWVLINVNGRLLDLSCADLTIQNHSPCRPGCWAACDPHVVFPCRARFIVFWLTDWPKASQSSPFPMTSKLTGGPNSLTRQPQKIFIWHIPIYPIYASGAAYAKWIITHLPIPSFSLLYWGTGCCSAPSPLHQASGLGSEGCPRKRPKTMASF